MRPLVIALAIAAGPWTVTTLSGQTVTVPDPVSEAPAVQKNPPRAFQLRGWTRTSVEKLFRVDSTGDDSRRSEVPHDDLVARELLYARSIAVSG